MNNRDLADGQHVGDATLAFFGGPGSLGPESIDADMAALGQAELGHFGSAVFFPDACAEEDRGDVFEVLADTLKPVYQADDLDGGAWMMRMWRPLISIRAGVRAMPLW